MGSDNVRGSDEKLLKTQTRTREGKIQRQEGREKKNGSVQNPKLLKARAFNSHVPATTTGK